MEEDFNVKQKALKLFHLVYQTSPAYRHFINSHKIDPSQIKSVSDWSKIPIMDRHNYINRYPLNDRLFEGKKLKDFYMISASSGSTGNPTLWPRDFNADIALEKKKEQLYEEHFQISKISTLCLVTFALGTWTAGMLTVKLSWAAAQRNKFTVVSTGMNKEEVLVMIKNLYKYYDQVLILGYPPFLTDLIAYSAEIGFDLKKANTKIMCTGDKFSEKWRTYITEKVSKTGNCRDVVGFYACSDTGIIGCETKKTIDILISSQNHVALTNSLFGSKNLPTFVTYDPNIKFLESINGEIIITAKQPVPLIRYNIHDRGGLLTGKTVKSIAHQFGIKLSDEDTQKKYVFVFGRSDAVIITANIYIEDIKYCLENSRFKDKLTGYFKYGRYESKNHKYGLKIIIYLKNKIKLNRRKSVLFKKEFTNNLITVNKDFRYIYETSKLKLKFYFKPDDPYKFKSAKLKYFL